MIRQLFSCLGWVTSEAVPMSEQGLVDWEAEHETHTAPTGSVGRPAGSSPQDAGAETPESGATFPRGVPDSGPTVVSEFTHGGSLYRVTVQESL